MLVSFLLMVVLIEPGAMVRPTRGGVWPYPQQMVTGERRMFLTDQFRFYVSSYKNAVLEKAVQRYWGMIIDARYARVCGKITETEMLSLKLTVEEPSLEDIRLQEGSDESYELIIGFKNESLLKAPTVWGALRGLETFSQLVYRSNEKLLVNSTKIKDWPRFRHRGLLLDTARHFIPKRVIYTILDGMAYNKLNVFHWHIVDDEAFPYVSDVFPELSIYGAYDSAELVYQQKDVRQIVHYAYLRGIRVIVEFDTPGHTRSWSKSHPNFFTKCVRSIGTSPFDPTNAHLYSFLDRFFTEVRTLFPDVRLHLGGDEVVHDCWLDHTHLYAFIKQHHLRNFTGLETYYYRQLVRTIFRPGSRFVFWEEVFYRFHGIQMHPYIAYQTWKGDGYTAAADIVKAEREVIFSCADWYLSSYLAPGDDWQRLYAVDPHNVTVSSKDQLRFIIGGEVCMWSEHVDGTNVVQRIFPRAAAAAEKLWSKRDAASLQRASARLEEHTCRMVRRGVPVPPANGPGFCVV